MNKLSGFLYITSLRCFSWQDSTTPVNNFYKQGLSEISSVRNKLNSLYGFAVSELKSFYGHGFAIQLHKLNPE